MDRRSVLKSLLAAPAAVPVAAKAAAQRMGLSTVMEADSYLSDNVPIEGNSPFVDGAWAREQLKELMSDMNVRRRRQQ